MNPDTSSKYFDPMLYIFYPYSLYTLIASIYPAVLLRNVRNERNRESSTRRFTLRLCFMLYFFLNDDDDYIYINMNLFSLMCVRAVKVFPLQRPDDDARLYT